jgi:hypothetical protein
MRAASALAILAGAAALQSIAGEAWAHKPVGPIPAVLAEVREVLDLLTRGEPERALSRARARPSGSRSSGHGPASLLEAEALRLDRLFGAEVSVALSRALGSRDPRALRHVLRTVVLLRTLEGLKAAEAKMAAGEWAVAPVAGARNHFTVIFEPILEEMDPLLHRELERALDRLLEHATAVRLDAFRAEREAFLRRLADAFDLSLPAR